jgi:hypothetical protein
LKRGKSAFLLVGHGPSGQYFCIGGAEIACRVLDAVARKIKAFNRRRRGGEPVASSPCRKAAGGAFRSTERPAWPIP